MGHGPSFGSILEPYRHIMYPGWARTPMQCNRCKLTYELTQLADGVCISCWHREALRLAEQSNYYLREAVRLQTTVDAIIHHLHDTIQRAKTEPEKAPVGAEEVPQPTPPAVVPCTNKDVGYVPPGA